MIASPERLTAISRLALVRAKVERANNNLIDMQNVLSEFHGGTPDRERYIKALKSRDGDTIRFTVPFDCLAAAGDVVNNLRSSLDHLVYQLADAYTPNCPIKALERTAFPIGEDEDGYKLAKRRIASVVHPEAMVVIDGMEPYKGGSKPGSEALYTLNKLNNISKHRMLLTVGEIVMCKADWVGEISMTDTFMYKVSDPQFTGIYAKPGDEDYVQSTPHESTGDPTVVGGDAMLPTLHYLVNFVRALIPCFLPYLIPRESLPPRGSA